MIVIVGLLILIVAIVVAVAGVTTNSGGSHAVGDSFGIFGQHMSSLSTGQLFLFGIGVGVVGMLGLSMLMGVFSRRLASRGSRRELMGSRRETTAVREDRDRLSQQLDDERTDRDRVEPTNAADSSSVAAAGQRPSTDEVTPGFGSSTDPGRVPPRALRMRDRIGRRPGH